MRLKLARIGPALLEAMREAVRPTPGLVGDLSFHGYDYRVLDAVAEGRAEAEEGTADWRTAYPWLARATGHGCATVEGYEFGYGPAFVLTPDEVRQVADGLRAEGWAGAFEDLDPFFAAAAAEGEAVIGGVD
ncbi:hypothetical protein [Streptomyces geranii]|uniref:hypothetical protein n=1 Tax=Streptomyces geranii TaxID=2058923 RepID=UPI0013008DFC|nr:hypothetical protein [Streptomyces geranii]